MQEDLFGEPPSTPTDAPAQRPPRRSATEVRPAPHGAALHALATALPDRLRLGTSSWTYPGWKGLVWDGDDYPDATLSKHGLNAYAQHPLLRSVCIDRGFYRPLTEAQYARYAAQVPDGFRFVVKAPSLVTDAQVRGEDGRGRQPNPAFLDPLLATQEFVAPALAGLGHKIGALVFQISPLPFFQLQRLPLLLERLRTLLRAQPSLQPVAPDGVIAVEVRDPEWLSPTIAPELAAVLREAGATYCLGLHAKLPPIEAQLPLLRALWPGPLVCRWSLHRRHGAYGYETAKGLYEPFDRLVDPDPETREVLAKVIAGTVGAGWPAYVAINNKAEGSAPLSVQALAQAVTARAAGG